MQFIANGPDVPDELLLAHEEGKVVFFCGAGISYSARLPGFGGLVSTIYESLGITPSPVQKAAIQSGSYDTAIGLLELEYVGKREGVRKALAEALKPNYSNPNATATHEALLDLSKTPNGSIRLITTNFDRIFEKIITDKSLNIPRFQAPLLPVPKNNWEGLIYLHGLIPESPTNRDLDKLVISSGDFGLSYLIERWAARFVSELFRNYSVCFVGYSLNDPVLRYMMDALAADQSLGGNPPKMFAFGSYAKGNEKHILNEWKAKNVTPILYKEYNRHFYLHNTLKTWANTWRGGTIGKESIVASHAFTKPSQSTPQDNFVGRMLWALSHKSGLPAKHFANLNPVPSLEWLDAFSDKCFTKNDLPNSNFCIRSKEDFDKSLAFSLMNRPSPYHLSPFMSLGSSSYNNVRLDQIMFYLASWLVRHLNDPKLILWIVKQGGVIHENFKFIIKRKIEELSKIDNNTKEKILLHSPNAIPNSKMKILWQILLNGQVKNNEQSSSYINIYDWKEDFRLYGLSLTSRIKIREILRPKIILREQIFEDNSSNSWRSIADIEVVIDGGNLHHEFKDFKSNKLWLEVLPELLSDFQQILKDALDLFKEVGQAEEHSDKSTWHLPSIEPHFQNKHFHDWTVLIELLRDSWLELNKINPELAAQIATQWYQLPYPTFKRLAFFAASKNSLITSSKWVNWLLTSNSILLWDSETKREVMRLLVLKGNSILIEDQSRLEEAILQGIPKELYESNISESMLNKITDYATWLRLKKLEISGVQLQVNAQKRLEFLLALNPHYINQLSPYQKEEFSSWSSGTGSPDYDDEFKTIKAPRKRKELVEWLKRPTDHTKFDEDDWRDNVCRTRFFHALLALYDLSCEDFWPIDRWVSAFQVWATDNFKNRLWRYAKNLIINMPDDIFNELVGNISYWLRELIKSLKCQEPEVLIISQRVLDIPLHAETSILRNGQPLNEPVMEAINHVIGQITDVIIDFWLITEPNDNDKLPPEIEILFTRFCDINIEKYRHARVILASRVILLFRVDPEWVKIHLLPLFNWSSNKVEAKYAWEGFLWSPRLYLPLMIELKDDLLNTANYYADLGVHKNQYSRFITYIALGHTDGYSDNDLRQAISKLPLEGLEKIANTLAQAIESNSSNAELYWQNNIFPFFKNIFPKSKDLKSENISGSLALLSVLAKNEFPKSLSQLLFWLQPIRDAGRVAEQLIEFDLNKKFPEDSLNFLDKITSNDLWSWTNIRKCLDIITVTKPKLQSDLRYIRLDDLTRQHGC